MHDELFDKEYTTDAIRSILAGIDGISERRMFGSNAFLIYGKLIGAASAEGMLVRVGADGMDSALAQPDAEPMRMGARTMGGFVRVDLDRLDADRLGYWIDRALTIAAALTPK